jgi:hypothetical protein
MPSEDIIPDVDLLLQIPPPLDVNATDQVARRCLKIGMEQILEMPVYRR